MILDFGKSSFCKIILLDEDIVTSAFKKKKNFITFKLSNFRILIGENI